tara:strand:+ start:731 stop:1375 length:645 start_codon:yes stop_codon:yes gene_type:complete
MTLRRLIREIIEEQASPGGFGDKYPKGHWIALSPGSNEFNLVRHQLYNLVNTAYEDMEGGHIKITGQGPEALDRYRFWAVVDHDEDPDIDIAIFGKPEFGTKSGGVGHDGSGKSVKLYKQQSANLRKGGNVGGIGNWWGEVSGRAAYGMLSRGAPAIEDEAKVRTLLAGDDIKWFGEHPSENAPPMFKKVKGWYEKDFGPGGKHTKILLGNPAI